MGLRGRRLACGLGSFWGRGRSCCQWPKVPSGAAGEEGPALKTQRLWGGGCSLPPPSPQPWWNSGVLDAQVRSQVPFLGGSGERWPFLEPNPHSCSSGHDSPSLCFLGSLASLAPHPQKPQQPHFFGSFFASSFHYFPPRRTPALYMAFPKAPCPHLLRGSPLPTSHLVACVPGEQVADTPRT